MHTQKKLAARKDWQKKQTFKNNIGSQSSSTGNTICDFGGNKTELGCQHSQWSQPRPTREAVGDCFKVFCSSVSSSMTFWNDTEKSFSSLASSQMAMLISGLLSLTTNMIIVLYFSDIEEQNHIALVDLSYEVFDVSKSHVNFDSVFKILVLSGGELARMLRDESSTDFFERKFYNNVNRTADPLKFRNIFSTSSIRPVQRSRVTPKVSTISCHHPFNIRYSLRGNCCQNGSLEWISLSLKLQRTKRKEDKLTSFKRKCDLFDAEHRVIRALHRLPPASFKLDCKNRFSELPFSDTDLGDVDVPLPKAAAVKPLTQTFVRRPRFEKPETRHGRWQKEMVFKKKCQNTESHVFDGVRDCKFRNVGFCQQSTSCLPNGVFCSDLLTVLVFIFSLGKSCSNLGGAENVHCFLKFLSKTKCPKEKLRINIQDNHDVVLSQSNSSGLSVCRDNNEIFHRGKQICKTCGSDPFDEPEDLRVLGRSNVKFGGPDLLQSQWIIAYRTNWFDRLTGYMDFVDPHGYRLEFRLGNKKLLSRGINFRRVDERPGQTGFITTRQDIFWDYPIEKKNLVLTSQGIVKLFIEKKDSYWKNQICRAIGYNFKRMQVFSDSFVLRDDQPDFELIDLDSPVGRQHQIIKVETEIAPYPVYYNQEISEVLTKGRPSNQMVMEKVTEKKNVSTVKPKTGSPETDTPNGDDWLLKFGVIGKANRSNFTNSFDDWNTRTSIAGYHAIVADKKLDDINYRAPPYAPKEGLKPSEPVVLHYNKKKASSVSSVSTISLQDEIRKGLSLRKVPESEKKHIENIVIARNSSKADIETNPGPGFRDAMKEERKEKFSEDSLPENPLASDYFRRVSRTNSGNLQVEVSGASTPSEISLRRRANSQGNSRLLFQGDSPVDPSIATRTTSTPVDTSSYADESEFEPVYRGRHCVDLSDSVIDEHDLPRGSEESDIEVNPGPDQRGRTGKPQEENLRIDKDDAPRARSRSPGGTKLIERSLNFLGLEKQTELTKFRNDIGLSDYEGFGPVEAVPFNWFSSHFDFHFDIGVLSSKKNFSENMPVRVISAPHHIHSQWVLDQSTMNCSPFQRANVGKLMELIHVFFGNHDASVPVSNHTIIALAHTFKNHFNCPDKYSYGIEILPSINKVYFHFNEQDKSLLVDRRLWFGINGFEIVHCGLLSQNWLTANRPNFSRTWKLACELAEEDVQWHYDDFKSKGMRPNWTNATDHHAHLMSSIMLSNRQAYAGNGTELLLIIQYYYPIYHFVILLWYWYSDFFWPDVREPLDIDPKSDSEYPPDPEFKPEESLLIATLGTKGDIIPLRYYELISKKFGVSTHFYCAHRLTTQELESLKQGFMYSSLSGWADLQYTTNLGYRRVFTPHFEIPRDKGLSYTLSPSNRFIRPTKFVKSFYQIPIYNWLTVEIAQRLHSVFDASFRIGSLCDSDLPRSANGFELLKQKKNRSDGKRVGWVCGSADESVIPLEIRTKYERITRTDHNDAFADFSEIYTHGGAGTVQTIIAAGATPIICDDTLDRNYHRVPTSKDFRQPTISKFMGWLVSAGFQVKAPIEIKIIWLCSYYWSQRWSYALDLMFMIIRAYTIIDYLRRNWSFFIIVYLSLPMIIWKALYRTKSLKTIISTISLLLWEFPLLCFVNSKLAFVSTSWSLRHFGQGVLQDLSAACKSRTHLVFEPVKRGNITFVFPFGHWALYDQDTKEIYEGLFKEPQLTIGSKFKFVKRQRELKPGARLFPVPFSIFTAMQLTKEDSQNYGPRHNCATLVFRVIKDRSFIWTIIMASAMLLIGVALQPPDTLLQIIRFFHPNLDPTKTAFYSKLGFAAGIENIPFETEDAVELDETPAIEKTQFDLDFDAFKQVQIRDQVASSHPQSFDALIDEIAVIRNTFSRVPSLLDDEDHDEVAARVLEKKLRHVTIPQDSMIRLEPLPPYRKHTWAQIVDMLHHAMSFQIANEEIRRIVTSFFSWLQIVGNNIYEFLDPLFKMLTVILQNAAEFGKDYFKTLFDACCHFLDHVWGLEASNRVKTAWGLTGLHKTGLLGVKAKLASLILFSEYVGRTDFASDYNSLVSEMKDLAIHYKAQGRHNIGGPQRRPVGYGKPLMTIEEAKLLQMEEGEYVTNPVYTKRIQEYMVLTQKQGGDGVFLAEKMEILKRRSQMRYEPKYPKLTSDDRMLAMDIALTMKNQYPEVFSDCDLLPPGAVHQYVKKKYSPGTPFINDKSFKSRSAMFDAGWDKVLKGRAIKLMEEGKYTPQFYHAFVKSQVVDIVKCLPPEMGGKFKDVRTVVSQDLASYYIDQVVQLERNKRINWSTYGAGIGMPLNQSMSTIFERMADHQKTRGGRYIIADATAFDSFCKPFLFEVNACLWELGYADHPSGNGKNIASIVRASYDARQNAHIIGVTEIEHKSLCVCVEDPSLREKFKERGSSKFCYLEDYINPANFRDMSDSDRRKFLRDVPIQENKLIITWSPDACPDRSNWMGSYRYGDIDKAKENFFKNQTFLYQEGNFEALYEDVKSVAKSDFALLSNTHFKNRGGSTGGSDTSNVNTHAFKAGMIYAWSKTMNRPPSEFFEYNDLANTSDDTIHQSGGLFGLNTSEEVERFKHYAAEVGIHLEIESTKNINKVEYLSKFVRTPTREDSETLRKWRSQRIKTIQHAHRQMGLPIPDSESETIQALNNPRFLVVQNPVAILLRRSAFRYYQSNANKWRYTSIERGSGHAMNTAFVPDLYRKFALEWCEDVNELLSHHKIHQKFELKADQNGLPNVVQVDPRSNQQSLSPRQKAFLSWLKGNMYLSYYKVVNIHLNIAKVDPEQHNKFLRKLGKGWRGWDEILREGVDTLFAITDSIPDEWSKKFQPQLPMLYAEQPFYTRNMITEKFIYLRLAQRLNESEITFAEISSLVQESPYAAVCDVYHFYELTSDDNYRKELLAQDVIKYQGLVLLISMLYMLSSTGESIILALPIVGVIYKLFLWSFLGLNKVYGLTNTMYWHSAGRSSREISRIMPRDPYMVSKQVCAFLVDLLPDKVGYIVMLPCLILDCLPPLLEAIGKIWYVAGEMKQVTNSKTTIENPWNSYADSYIEKLRQSPTNRAYVSAKTSTGKSTMFVAALWSARNRQRVRAIWLVEPRRILRDQTVIPFDIPTQILSKGVIIDETITIRICTYGHFLSRMDYVNSKEDIVLFDEFHELQGEMILALDRCEAPILLLSATPAPIDTLKGSPFFTPNIDRRHPITIHKVPDNMNVVDMVIDAQNKYPELVTKMMVIVPTHKDVTKTVASLNYLKLGLVEPLSSRDRNFNPNYNILVCTPYVQTGLDIKPAPMLLIDCGKDVVIDKGILIHPLPWTNRDVNQQRIGRVGRLCAGVVYQPESAGTGTGGILYPSPFMFMHPVVATHFKVPNLTPVTAAPICVDLPFMSIDKTILDTKSKRRSVATIHALSLCGVQQQLWESLYTKLHNCNTLGEDYDLVNRVTNSQIFSKAQLLPYHEAIYNVHIDKVVAYSIGGKQYWKRPMTVKNGKWIELESSPTHNLIVKETTHDEFESMHVHMQRRYDKMRSAVLTHAAKYGREHLQKCIDIMT